MQRHVLDRPKSAPKAALDRAVKIEKSDGPSKATLDLQRRPRNENTAQRARHFLKIERDGGV